jgi:hypothetical protein
VEDRKTTQREKLAAIARSILNRLRRRREPEQPEDPHSYVMAPKKPRPNQGRAAAVVELPEE